MLVALGGCALKRDVSVVGCLIVSEGSEVN
jgi:hypothetical protein